MHSLTIYVLCHNRPIDGERAIQSILKQTNQTFQLIVSDNSTNDDVQNLVLQKFPAISYIRRPFGLSAIDHIDSCIQEATPDYFCLFHDDDIMHPDFVKIMRKHIEQYPQAIALASNACIESLGVLSNKPSFFSFRSLEIIKNANDLANRYYGRSPSGIAPFPSYIYNKKMLKNQTFIEDGGKYSDSTWLMKLANIGSIVWVNMPLITYRYHTNNDGQIESRFGRLRTLAFLKKNYVHTQPNVIHDYRCSFIYKPIVRNNSTKNPQRYNLAKKYLWHYQFRRYFYIATYVAVVKRFFNKKFHQA